MDFDLSTEQTLLQDSVRRLLQDQYGAAQRRAYRAEPEGFSRAMWRRYAELGLLGLPFPERFGGSEATAVETMIVMEALGEALALEPYLPTVLLGGGLIGLAGSAVQQEALLAKIAAGECLVAFAHGEPKARYALSHVETRAEREGGSFILSGSKSVVLHGGSADKLIVSARSAGDARDESGIGLFLVDGDAPGVARRAYQTVDELQAADITFDRVRIEAGSVLGPPDGAFPIIEHAVERAIAALCAEAVGIMAALNRLTLDYIKTRKQFGVAIGSFQVLQHRMVEMIMEQEQAKSMAILAALAIDGREGRERSRAISAVKAQIGRSGRFVGEQAIQLHGGIGMTGEYQAGHYFKRLTMIDRLFGDADHHTDRFAALGRAAS